MKSRNTGSQESAPSLGRQSALATPPENCSTSVFIIDECEPFAIGLEGELRALGMPARTAQSFRAATALLSSTGPPSCIVSELRVNGKYVVDFMKDVTTIVPANCFVIATAYPSIATAVLLTRMGVASYLTKPISAIALLAILGEQLPTVVSSLGASEAMSWPTLDRTIWEYISHVHTAAGSISEAARRLGVDRRSLRRMLAKHPPSR